ncbi:MAG: Slp family lipoprotein [Wenzhouxiangella sp.]|jgi:outer membrane lipoprotein|nr:Slp family lipoprotein [Wenzhouxiangella sp.]
MTETGIRPSGRRWAVVLALVVLIISGCATSPFESEESIVSGIGPAHALAESGHEGQRAIWGGRIVSVSNLADRTEIEVVSLPLDRGDRPRLGAEGGVRFVLVQPGFLEPTRYAPGRYLTVLGQIEGVEARPVGDYLYDHPVLSAESIHLWPADTARWQSRSRFSIGIGIRL